MSTPACTIWREGLGRVDTCHTAVTRGRCAPVIEQNNNPRPDKTPARPAGLAEMAGWGVASLANILDIGFAMLLPSVSFGPNPGRCDKCPHALVRDQAAVLADDLAGIGIIHGRLLDTGDDALAHPRRN